ncbi:MAG: hypothetical protein EOM19_05665, partial [Candidatus Moranbacteria bacterium]|nr:hypothetical protein [Candidatus Moranbacteria bacterium]
ENVGIIELSSNQTRSDEEIELEAIEGGVQDIEKKGFFTFFTQTKDLKTIEKNFLEKNIRIENSSIGYRPLQKITPTKEEIEKYTLLLTQLDEQEDVQNIYDNLS